MRKRLRKKLHVGEFQELGCEVRFQVVDNLSHEAVGKIPTGASLSRALGAAASQKRTVELWKHGLQIVQRSIPSRWGRSSMRGILPDSPLLLPTPAKPAALWSVLGRLCHT